MKKLLPLVFVFMAGCGEGKVEYLTYQFEGVVKRDGKYEKIPLWVKVKNAKGREGYYEAVEWSNDKFPDCPELHGDTAYYKTLFSSGGVPGPGGEIAVVIKLQHKIE